MAAARARSPRRWTCRRRWGGGFGPRPVLRDRLLALWVRTEATRLTNLRASIARTSGTPGPEGSVGKLAYAEENQQVYELCIDLMGADGMRYGSDYPKVRPGEVAIGSSDLHKAFLRARANSIEGGTSEVMRNILGERVLGLPGEPRADKESAWKDVPGREAPGRGARDRGRSVAVTGGGAAAPTGGTPSSTAASRPNGSSRGGTWWASSSRPGTPYWPTSGVATGVSPPWCRNDSGATGALGVDRSPAMLAAASGHRRRTPSSRATSQPSSGPGSSTWCWPTPRCNGSGPRRGPRPLEPRLVAPAW